MPNRVFRLMAHSTMLLCVTTALSAAQLGAQATSKTKGGAATAASSIVGSWQGKATVPLPDSTIIVPIFYNFTQTAGAIGGMAMVPGQGSGPISNFVQTGSRIQFRVTAPEGKLLEHDGTLGADGSIEGMVNLDNAPIAKFKIDPKPSAPAKK